MLGPAGGSDDRAVIAHRGFAGVNPENTLAAVRHAPEQGADAVEVDVMPAADGEVVVFHDPTPTRVTDAAGPSADRPVWETPLSSLRELDVLGTGEPVPLLSEVLEAVPDDVAVNVEFKHPGDENVRFAEHLSAAELADRREAWRPLAERTLAALAESDHDVLVSSFYEGALAAVRELAPELPLSVIFWDSVEDGLAIARRHDCETLQIPRNMVPGTSMFGSDYAGGPFETVDVLDVAHREGRAVTAWTIETWRQAAELERAGVDAIMADYPGLDRHAVAGGAVATSDD